MRVAVLGAGYAGLTLAKRLEDALPDDEVVVVDEDGTHLVQHELHRVVRRPSLAEDITLDLADVLDRATVREATVTDVDPEAGVATLRTGGTNGTESGDTETLDYDVAAVCLGATTNYYDLPGVREYSTPLKRLADARAIRAEFLAALEAGAPDDPARVVVGGAGLSGVQVAGELAALADELADGTEPTRVEITDLEDADGGDTHEGDGDEEPDDERPPGESPETVLVGGEDASDAVEVLLLEQKAHVAPEFPANFQRAVRDQLESRGVTVRTGTAVERADAEGIDLATGERVSYDQFVWTGGIAGSPALDGDRPVVRKDLRLDGTTFVLGDAGRVVDTDGEAVPASAQAAIRQARVAADNIERLVEYEREGERGFRPRLDGYRFDSPGWIVSVGDGAVAQIGPTVLTGRPAKLAKASVGAGYLSSVGAVAKAADLVREELGWPDEDESADEADGTDDNESDDGPDDDGPVRITIDDEDDE
jgi:NADH dehydrogenase